MDRKNKNQVDVTLGGETLTLRATFDFFDAAAESVEKVGDYITRRGELAGLHKHLLTVYVEGARAAGGEPDDGHIKDLIVDAGLTNAATKLEPFLTVAHFGGEAFEEHAKKK